MFRRPFRSSSVSFRNLSTPAGALRHDALLLGSILCVAVIGCIFLALQWSARQAAVGAAYDEASFVARPLAANVDILIETIDRGLLSVRDSVLAEAENGPFDRQSLFLELRRSLDHAVTPVNYALVAADGRLIASSRSTDPGQLDLSDRAYFLQHRTAATDRLYLGAPIENRLPDARGIKSIPMSRGVWDLDGGFLGVVLATIPASYLGDLFQHVHLRDNAFLGIATTEGFPLATMQEDDGLFADSLPAALMLEAEQGRMETKPLRDGDRRFVAWTALPDVGLVVVAAIPAGKALAVWHAGMIRNGGLVAAFAFILVGGAFVSTRAAARKDGERLRSQEMLNAALSGIADPIVLLDSDCRMILSNKAADSLVDQPHTGSALLFDRFSWITANGYQRIFLEAKETRQPVQEEVYLAGRDLWLSLLVHPLPTGTLVHARDVTQDRRVSEQLYQAQKMETVGQLTGGIAHDFNNLLTVIIGNLELITLMAQDRPEIVAATTPVMRAAERGAELTASLLAVGRRQALRPEPTDVNGLIRSLHLMTQRLMPENIEVRLCLQDDAWAAEIDAAKLESAILNLIVNARDAMPRGGKVSIDSGNVVLDADYAAQHREVVPGEYLMIAVTDSGPGMTPDVIAKAFDPFFTTKAAGKGSGLGLSMVLGFVKQSRGHINIYSELGVGTSVKLYLPRSMSAATSSGTEEPDDTPQGMGTVLLVEDDELVREHVARMLAKLGYRFFMATNGREALRIIEREAIDVLLTDVTLPEGMNGREVAEKAAAYRPAIKCIYMSGYTRNAIVHQGRLDSGIAFLPKPFRLADLAAMLRQTLTEAEQG